MGYTLTHDHLGQNYYANSMAGGPAGFCIHHAAGTQLNVKSTFLTNSTSANYSIKDGDVVCYVEDANGTWHCGDNWGNRNLISIECVNSGGSSAGWPVSETTVDTLVEFLADKCVEHGISSLTVGGNLYKHSDFYATYCPGVLADRMEEIAARVNAILAMQETVERDDGMGLILADTDTGVFYWWHPLCGMVGIANLDECYLLEQMGCSKVEFHESLGYNDRANDFTERAVAAFREKVGL